MAGSLVVELFDERVCDLAEAPWYDERTGRAGWVDIIGRRVLWRDLDSGETGEFSTDSEVGAAVPRAEGGLVLVLAAGPVLADPDGTLTPLDPYDDPEPGVSVRANDGKADPGGRLWFGTMDRAMDTPRGALYRLDPGTTTPRRMVSGITISNGLGWHGQRMYYVDSPSHRVDVSDYDPATGDIDNRRPFVDVGGPADGICVDADGCVWVTAWGAGAVRRYTPDGGVDRELTLPTPQVTSCAFAGADYRTLIVTTGAEFEQHGVPGAGMVYVERLADVAGLPVDRFAG
jgi:sugar lactone lactonase YvrE